MTIKHRGQLVSSLFAVLLAMAACPCIVAEARQPLNLKQGDTIVFLGDSITQQGNRENGYVALVRQHLEAQHGKLKLNVIGAGISGNKVPDLQGRLDRDVLSKKPQWVVIYIGINDVWHSQSGRGTSKEAYEKGLRDLIKRIRAGGARVILCTPSVIGEKTDGSNDLDKMLDEYASISREVAKDTGTPLLDLRKRFLDHLRKENAANKSKGILTGDGVHLNAAGNQFVAQQVLETLVMSPTRNGQLLRHVVLFKFKDEVTEAEIKEVVEAFGKLPSRMDEIHAFEWGTDVSVESKAQGFTHCFLVTFRTEADRDTYLPHAAHQEFVSLVKARLEKVLVVDYWAN